MRGDKKRRLKKRSFFYSLNRAGLLFLKSLTRVLPVLHFVVFFFFLWNYFHSIFHFEMKWKFHAFPHFKIHICRFFISQKLRMFFCFFFLFWGNKRHLYFSISSSCSTSCLSFLQRKCRIFNFFFEWSRDKRINCFYQTFNAIYDVNEFLFIKVMWKEKKQAINGGYTNNWFYLIFFQRTINQCFMIVIQQ